MAANIRIVWTLFMAPIIARHRKVCAGSAREISTALPVFSRERCRCSCHWPSCTRKCERREVKKLPLYCNVDPRRLHREAEFSRVNWYDLAINLGPDVRG